MSHRVTTFCLVLAAVLCCSCSPIKGYSGPDLPKEQLAIVYLKYDDDEVALERATSNGTEFGWRGISLLPGKVDVQLSLGVKDEPFNCQRCYEFDDSGYRNCLDDYYKHRDDDSKHYRQCYREDYTQVREKCDQRVYDANCNVAFSAAANAEYVVNMIKRGTEGGVTVAQKNNPTPVGYGECSTFRDRVEKTDEYLGSGSSYSPWGLPPCGW
jgi:hypothetical protein